MENVDSKNDPVSLEPFIHQVGGHSSFQQFEQFTVCKPLFSKELEFYQEMPSALKPFIPKFKGVVTAQLKEDCKGNARLIVLPESSMHFRNCDDSKNCSVSDDYIHHSLECRCCNDQQSYLGSTSKISNPQQYRYLILENVISGYHHPSILDLKMGTDVHSDYKTSEEEMQRRRQKWEKTTASSLGVRLSGMKVYRVDYGEFLCKSKTFGSMLTAREFKEALVTFFFNGRTFRCELIECFMKRLEAFLKVMENDLSSYRFYSSSLLLVYEGEVQEAFGDTPPENPASRNCSDFRTSLTADCPEQCKCICTLLDRIDIRMIDFAHVSHCNKSTGNPSCNPGPDNGYIFGLKSLISILREIQEEKHQGISARRKSNGTSLESKCSRCNIICHLD